MAELKNIKLLVRIVRFVRKVSGISPETLDVKYSKIKAPSYISQYLRTHDSLRLHVGCQHHPLDGWLNVDIKPFNSRVTFMDATKPFPLPDKSFDYIFSEHMIEHVTLEEGAYMLQECYRILKTGGIIRIVTPDITLLRNLLLEPDQRDHAAYIEFSKRYFNKSFVFNEVVVVNNFFRDWGHKFIYDETTLASLLHEVGFRNIVRCQVGLSQNSALNGLERHHLEITERFNRLESMVIEAEK